MVIALMQSVVLVASLGGFAVTFAEFQRAWQQGNGRMPDLAAARRRRETHIQAIKDKNWNGLQLGAAVLAVGALALLLCCLPVAALRVFPSSAPLAGICAFGTLLWVRQAVYWFVGRFL